MNKLLKFSISAACVFAACGNDDNGPNGIAGGSVEDHEVIIAINDKTISGVSQKGPFVNGSSVTVHELKGKTLAQTGRSYEGKIKNDRGEFSLNVVNLESQFALLKANGYYRNEVTGKQSKSPITLYALSDLSNRDEVNVNLLTHLEYERSLYLVKNEGLTVAKAKKQAEEEVLASFGIKGDIASSEDLNIFGSGDGSAALLAISVMMQSNLSDEGDFSKRLADYATDIEEDGVWDDSEVATSIADWAAGKSLGYDDASYRMDDEGEVTLDPFWSIRENIEGWEISDKVPAFEKFIENFWWENYKLGACTSENDGDIKKNGNSASRYKDDEFACIDGAWIVASYFTYIMLETRNWEAGKEGEIRIGDVSGATYIFVGNEWRSANDIEVEFGGCITATADSLVMFNENWYICRNGEWTKAKTIEYNTHHWGTGKDGDAKWGNVDSSACYVYEDSTWRRGNKLECSLGLGGCTAARTNETVKAESGEYYVCTENGWRIQYAPDGTCSPSKDSVMAGESVTWTFTIAKKGGSVADQMDYNARVGSSTCDWTIEGAETATHSGACGEDGKTVTTTYSSAGSFSTSIKIGENTINCEPIKVIPAEVTGCSCVADRTKVDVDDADEATATWTVSGCKVGSSNANIASYAWTAATAIEGDESSATLTFTEKGHSVSPFVKVTTAEGASTTVNCTTVSSPPDLFN